jgi:hypothetical protein
VSTGFAGRSQKGEGGVGEELVNGG